MNLQLKFRLFLLAGLACVSSAQVFGAAMYTPDNLYAYWDFKNPPNQATSSNPVMFNPYYSKGTVATNIFKDSDGSSLTCYGTGGMFDGGYIAANSKNTSGKNFTIYSGLANVSTSASKGFSLSMQTKGGLTQGGASVGTSFSFNFTGDKGDDSTFTITNTGVSAGGIAANAWKTVGVGTLSLTDWTSLVFSVDDSGMGDIYLGGELFATTRKTSDSNEDFNLFSWNRWQGSMSKLSLGSKFEGAYGWSQSSFSDFAIWDTSLSAEDAAFLAKNAAINLGNVPEPCSSALMLLGTSLLLRRRRTNI